MSKNKIILLGNIGEPKIETFGDKKKATFSLATSDRAYKKADGTEVPEKTEWHNIVCWHKLAEIVEKYYRKGMKVYVEGKVHHRKFNDSNGVERIAYEVEPQEMELCNGKNENTQQPAAQPTMSQGVASAVQTLNNAGLQVEATGDGLPF